MPEPVVEVTAVGRAHAVPDQVAMSLGVEVTTPTVGQSLRDADDAVGRLLAYLDEAGVAGADRQTTGLSVDERWHEPGQPGGHTATYRLRLVVRDLESAGLLVQQAGDRVGDALRVQGFQLAVADPRPQQEQARRDGVAACRRQAEQLADAAGATLGDLLALVEGDGRGATRSGWVPQSSSRGGGMAVEAGELEVAVAVTATWRLRTQAASRQAGSAGRHQA